MNHEPSTILVVCTRRIGDLLATSAVRFLKQAYPGVSTHMLVFAATDGVLKDSSDLKEFYEGWGLKVSELVIRLLHPWGRDKSTRNRERLEQVLRSAQVRAARESEYNP